MTINAERPAAAAEQGRNLDEIQLREIHVGWKKSPIGYEPPSPAIHARPEPLVPGSAAGLEWRDAGGTVL